MLEVLRYLLTMCKNVIFLYYYFVHISTNVKNITEFRICFERLMIEIIPLFGCNI